MSSTSYIVSSHHRGPLQHTIVDRTKDCTVPTHATHVCTHDQRSLKCVSLLSALCLLFASPPTSFRGVGCILYEMATGRPMFPGATVKEELHLIFRLIGKIAAHYHDILQVRLKSRNILTKNEHCITH